MKHDKYIVITGCMGFIGSNLTIHLLNKGFKVVGFDSLINPSIDPTDRIKLNTKHNYKNFYFYNIDCKRVSEIGSVLVNHEPQAFIHLAARGSVPKSFIMPSDYILDNEIAFINMMNLSMKFGCRFIFASSSSVYGDIDEHIKEESTIGNALSPYALTKQNNERYAAFYEKKGLQYIALRFFNVYGKGQRFDSDYSPVISKFLNLNVHTINGDGSQRRDFTHVDDVCRAIELSLTTENVNQAYNVGTGKTTSILELHNLINKNAEIKYNNKRDSDVSFSQACTLKAKRMLNFVAEIDIKEGINRSVTIK